MSSSLSRPSQRPASRGTSGSSSQAVSSPLSPSRYNGPSMIKDPNSFELQTVSPHREPLSKEELENDEQEGLLPSMRRPSLDSVQSYELYTPDEDRAVVKKLDRRLVVFMAFLYMLSFLDRSSE